MQRTWRRPLGVLIVLATALCALPAMAADHLDSPTVSADATVDINDLYVFRSTDADDTAIERTVFVMTVFPLADNTARFSDAVEYNFHALDVDTGTEYTITCTADDSVTQNVTCVAPTGAQNTTALNDTTDGDRAGGTEIIAYAGINDDPFFFDLNDFSAVYQSVLDGAADPSPLLDGMGTDFFAGANSLVIVVDIRNSVFGGATTLAVWAETTKLAN